MNLPFISGNNFRKFFTHTMVLIFIIVLAFLLRAYHFTTNPPSLYVDEVSLGYNAYSLLKTGRDEYGTLLPFFIRSFNIYSPPLSAYALIPSIAVFGLNEASVRLPAVLFGTLLIPVSFFLVLELFKTRKLALFTSFFLAVSPWHLHFSRFYHEPNLTVFFSCLGALLYLKAGKNRFFYILSAISFVVSINFSHIGKAFVPFIVFFLFLIFPPEFKKNKKYILIALIIGAIGMAPHLLFVNKSFHRASPVSIFTNEVGDKKEKFIEGYLSHFSPRFLFNKGDYQGRHSVPGMGELYVFTAPLILFGLYTLVKKLNKGSIFTILWLITSQIPAALATQTPHAGRALMVTPIWSILIALGTIYALKNIKWFLLWPLFAVGLYNFLTYIHLYHAHYPKEKAIDWADGYKEMNLFLKSKYDDYERIAVTRYWGHPYIYTLFYHQFDPNKYHSQSENKYEFDKFEFYLGAPKPSNKKTLFVSTAEHAENNLKEIKLNNGDLFFTIHE